MLLKCFLVSHVKNSSHQIKNKYLFLLLSTLCKKIKRIAALPFHCCYFMLWAIGPCTFGFFEYEGTCEDTLKLIGCFLVTAERLGPSFIHKPLELSCSKKKSFSARKTCWASLCKARLGVWSGINQNHLKHVKEQSFNQRWVCSNYWEPAMDNASYFNRQK